MVDRTVPIAILFKLCAAIPNLHRMSGEAIMTPEGKFWVVGGRTDYSEITSMMIARK